MYLENTIRQLLSISAPAGHEKSITTYLKHVLSSYLSIDIVEDNLGNLMACKKGGSNQKIMLVAHCDEIGFVIKHIDESGFIRFSPIGGIDISVLKGLQVSIKHNENIINGIVGVKPIHLSRNEHSNRGLSVGDLWIDIGATSKEDAMSKVSIGDAITFKENYLELKESLFSSKSIDNRVGVAALLAVLDGLANVETKDDVFFVFSVQEELGLRGATAAGYKVNPDICIAIDVTHATDYPTLDKNSCGDIRIDAGPVIPIGANFHQDIQKRLINIAEEENIHYQLEAIPGYSGTDVAQVQLTRGGIKTGLISIPCRYMHTPVEVASFNDIKAAINILIKYCIQIS